MHRKLSAWQPGRKTASTIGPPGSTGCASSSSSSPAALRSSRRFLQQGSEVGAERTALNSDLAAAAAFRKDNAHTWIHWQLVQAPSEVQRTQAATGLSY